MRLGDSSLKFKEALSLSYGDKSLADKWSANTFLQNAIQCTARTYLLPFQRRQRGAGKRVFRTYDNVRTKIYGN